MKMGAWLLLAVGAVAAAEPARWALVIGENEGLPAEGRLRFAEVDARRVLSALHDVGHVTPERSVAVLGADPAAVRGALGGLRRRLEREATLGDWLIVYVSAHAGDAAIHLRGGELPMKELLEFLRAAPVGVGMLVLDACQSGAATRLKGLRPTSGAVTVSAAQLEGRIVLSSSGADEYAQESDALQGSFFTHHLVVGLRGAADRSGDGRVTLEEAYGYAYARTLESTLASAGGAQRPAFAHELRGRGELVVSEPRRGPARLTLAVESPGHWVVISEAGGALVAELEKGEGTATLALPPGGYRLRLKGTGAWLERRVVVPAGGGAVVRGAELERASLARLASKGLRPPGYRLVGAFSVASGLVQGLMATTGAAVWLRRDRRQGLPLDALLIGAAVRSGRGGRIAFEQREVELSFGMGPTWHAGPLELSALVEPGVLLVFQSGFPNGSSRFGLEPALSLGGEARLRLWGPVALSLHAAVGAAAIRTELGVRVVPRATGTAGLGINW